MSDDPILAALARLETEQMRLREQINGKLDNILDQMSSIRQDVETVHGHVLFGLQNNLTLGQRITKLEDEMRRRGQ
jgi:hypothetical protein